MITENITLVKIVASDGMTLTNGEVYGKEAYLGKGDNLENWYEITDKEYQEILEKEIGGELDVLPQ